MEESKEQTGTNENSDKVDSIAKTENKDSTNPNQSKDDSNRVALPNAD